MTAKLSRKFYERLGDEVANELVEWFNQVDAAYRSEFRELFEVHFGRIDSKLAAELGRLDTRMAAFEARIIRWMFLFWVGTLGTLVALLKL